MHPMLAPGTHVLRRGRDEVQVGLDPDRSVVLRERSQDVKALERPDLVATLAHHGLVDTDDHALRGALPAEDAGAPWTRHTLAALARRVRAELPRALAARSSWVVVVAPFGHPTSRDLGEQLSALCHRAGLLLPQRRRPGPAPKAYRPPRPVHVLVGVGEPSRDLTDGWVRDGEPHLVVRLVEGRAVVGPLVVPGRTACVRCIDAYLTEEDPSWPLLVEQYARASAGDRADGIPEPVDAALATVAVGWAVRELASYVEVGATRSLSTTIRLSPTLDEIETRTWSMHPHCGCAWT
jgi:bacteriocin biosynthesis cyclodehydratase domain-containing protein